MRIEHLSVLLAYLLGSIPFGYVLVKLASGSDIRSAGSGNIGATNVFRKNRWAGILTLLLDAGKGYLSVVLAAWMGGDRNLQAMAALAAILGHVFTIFLGFKGGKGVATGCGAYLALSPLAVVTTMIPFILVLALTRYVSLASIVAAALFPLWAHIFHEPPNALIWMLAGSIVIVAKHHQNIRRLLSGTENKFALGSHS